MVAAGCDENRCCATLVCMTGVRTFQQLVGELRARPGVVRIVGVDGCGGAGKTTFATRMSHAAGDCPVVHTDDFASHADALGWWPRLVREVLEPLSQGRPASYVAYDWVNRCDGPIVTVPPADIVIVEGVSATRQAFRDFLAMRIWIDAPRVVRLRRGIARDGEELREFWDWWLRAEDAYVAAERPDLAADLLVDGDPPQRPAEHEFVVLSAPSGAGGAAPLPR